MGERGEIKVKKREKTKTKKKIEKKKKIDEKGKNKISAFFPNN